MYRYILYLFFFPFEALVGADVSILCGLPSNKREMNSFFGIVVFLGCHESFPAVKL
tara:strand:+ start:1372 stop:1539 length:168 start_codon:yes stop_codon:yes gene_type:complete